MDIPKGLCQCGCGQRTKIARQTRTKYGQVRGEPLRFVHGHHQRGGALPMPERFWERVDRRGSDECWLWTGTMSRGYGRFTLDKTIHAAHRFAYELSVGHPLPHGTHVHHVCRNPACVNPAHLELMSELAHLQHHGKLSAEQAAEIREVVDALCKKYGVGPQTLADIGKRHTWKDHHATNARSHHE